MSALRHHSKIEKVFPFNNEDVALKPSWIKHRDDLNIAFLKSLDPDRLLHNFRVTAGLHSDAEPLEGWEAPDIGLRGHFVGALSFVRFQIGKKRTMTLNCTSDWTYLITELNKCKLTFGNGYLSAFPEKDFDTLERRFTGV